MSLYENYIDPPLGPLVYLNTLLLATSHDNAGSNQINAGSNQINYFAFLYFRFHLYIRKLFNVIIVGRLIGQTADL